MPLGLAQRMAPAARLHSVQSIVVRRRLLSSSHRLLATPTVQPNTRDAGVYEDPYKGGPSAIDKAVHIFFFTEIMRGASSRLSRVVTVDLRRCPRRT